MATAGTVHFSDFANATTLTGSESMVGLQNGQNVQITPAQLFGFISTTPGTLSNKTVNTAQAGDSSGAIASTQFVTVAISGLAPEDAPTFTGNATFAGASFSGAVNFSSRPTFGANIPWDSGNFTPANCLAVTGGVIQSVSASGSSLQVLVASGSGHEFGGAAQQAYHDFHASGGAVEDYDARISVSGPAAPVAAGQGAMSFTAASFAFSARPTFGSSTPWDSANLPTPFQTTGGTITGATSFSVRPSFAGTTPWDAVNLPFPFETSGGTINGATTINDVLTCSAFSAQALTVAAEQGGGYGAGIRLQNTSSGATNPFKSLRINSVGSLEFVNSAYSAVISTMDDSGSWNLGGALTVSGTANFSSTGSFIGWLNAPGFQLDGSAYFTLSGNNVYVNANPNSYMNYDRLAGAWGWTVNSVVVMNIDGGGNVFAVGNGNFNDVEIRSDARIKTIFGPIDDAAKLIQRTRAYRGTKNGKPGFFLIAQEAREVTPELVGESSITVNGDPDPLLTLDLLSYVPILLEEVKRLRLEVEALKADQ